MVLLPHLKFEGLEAQSSSKLSWATQQARGRAQTLDSPLLPPGLSLLLHPGPLVMEAGGPYPGLLQIRRTWVRRIHPDVIGRNLCCFLPSSGLGRRPRLKSSW